MFGIVVEMGKVNEPLEIGAYELLENVSTL